MFFIYCFDEELKNNLTKSGYKLIKTKNNVTIFQNQSSVKFNFNEIDKSKYTITNKLTF